MKRPTDQQAEHYWIESYLHGHLPAEERAVVEAEMEADPALQNEVLLLKRTHELMQEAFLEQRAIATVKRLQATNRPRSKGIRRIRLVSRSLAGIAVIGLVLIAYLSLVPVSFPDSENDINVTRSLADDSSAVMQQRVFGEFFEGQTHLTEGQYALAVKNFEQVVRNPDIRPYFREAAQWHLTVAYLKSGQPAKAQRMYDQFKHCIDCEYAIGSVDRWKIWWQIQWAKWI